MTTISIQEHYYPESIPKLSRVTPLLTIPYHPDMGDRPLLVERYPKRTGYTHSSNIIVVKGKRPLHISYGAYLAIEPDMDEKKTARLERILKQNPEIDLEEDVLRLDRLEKWPGVLKIGSRELWKDTRGHVYTEPDELHAGCKVFVMDTDDQLERLRSRYAAWRKKPDLYRISGVGFSARNCETFALDLAATIGVRKRRAPWPRVHLMAANQLAVLEEMFGRLSRRVVNVSAKKTKEMLERAEKEVLRLAPPVNNVGAHTPTPRSLPAQGLMPSTA